MLKKLFFKNLFFRFFILGILLTDSLLFGQSCSGCTVTISSSSNTNYTVNSGQIYCFTGGTYTGSITLKAGGTICIASGATFTPSISELNGSIINNGTMSFNYYNAHSATIVNYGTFTTTGWQSFQGNLENRGTINLNGYVSFPNNSYINSYGIFNANNGGNFDGTVDNSGTMKFYGINLNGILNNYSQMSFYTSLNVGTGTYVTNDTGAVLETVNISGVQFNGPMLTNNGTINIKSSSNSAEFKMNQAINQVYNNGLIYVEGDFEQNAAGSLLVNSCRIISRDYKIQNGLAKNSGLISASRNFNNSGTGSYLTNSATGRIQSDNFTNSGSINGFGEFYFTGTTNINTSGTFEGDSSSNPIKVYDTSAPANSSTVFDSVPWAYNPVAHNIQWSPSMTFLDPNSFNCTAPPSPAGSPPTTNPVSIGLCDSHNITFNISDYATPAPPVGGDPFILLNSTIKLFEYNNNTNGTNNTTHLVIPGKGTFDANTTTGVITFTPDPAFTAGMVAEAEYRISNKRSGDPITYPSQKTKITVTFNVLPNITKQSGDNPLCIGNQMTLSNTQAGGTWSSDTPAVATVSTNGVVTGVSAGAAIISYTANFPSFPENTTCQLTKTYLVTVQSCGSGNCYKPGNMTAASNPSRIGISTLSAQLPGWPGSINNGFIVMESKNKGFVITRVANAAAIADPKEGMLIYDNTANCIKLYNGTVWGCIQQYCPD